ncbi:hypothetical protein EDD22DRAFT_848232 [Suillus occidentalis]|nr:hypothetical protein EDD22DRAFT_848232 [Suillus occidentalis]
MAPKRSSNPTIRPPAKKAKVGAVLSGISRAAPGVVHIGSMVSSMDLLGASRYMQDNPIEDSEINSFQPPTVLPNVMSIAGPAAAAATSTSTINPSLMTVTVCLNGSASSFKFDHVRELLGPEPPPSGRVTSTQGVAQHFLQAESS